MLTLIANTVGPKLRRDSATCHYTFRAQNYLHTYMCHVVHKYVRGLACIPPSDDVFFFFFCLRKI